MKTYICSPIEFTETVKSFITPNAHIALPGGTTPQHFLPLLQKSLVHSHVIPTDERVVADDSTDSNYRFLQSYLGDSVHKILNADRNPIDLEHFFPLDLAVVGMGNDGHIASLFPGYDPVDEKSGQNFVSVAAPTHIAPHVPRVSLTWNALLQAKTLVLVFAGQEKSDVWRDIVSNPAKQNLPAALLLTRHDLIVCQIKDTPH